MSAMEINHTVNNNNTEQLESIIPPPPSIPTDTKDDITTNTANNDLTQEPPTKRMKVASPQIPHYNSHNIYSRPPAPSSSIPIPSLPSIVPPVNPLDSDLNTSSSTLPKPAEDWPLCAYCDGDDGGDLSRCSSCRQAYYCNRECQVAHWEVHCIICQPGPPQPAELPNNGQPVRPPTHITHYPVQQAHHQQQQQQHHGPGPYGNNEYTDYSSHHPSQMNGSGPSTRRRYNDSNRANGDGINREQYYCAECDRYFKNGQALGGHRSRVHSSRRNGGGDGSTSSRRKRPRPSRARHTATGSGQYVCPHCSREFASGNALGGHISGAHTKKSKRAARERYDNMHHPTGYARPRHPNF